MSTSLTNHVYLLKSTFGGINYVGISSDVDQRLNEHNSGKCKQTKKHRPWKLMVSISFNDEKTARRFERYLKTGSGRAFVKRHFG